MVTRHRRLLVTGFGAFPSAPLNPTQTLIEALRTMPAPAGLMLDLHVLPVVWDKAPSLIRAAIADAPPDAIVLFGLAGRSRVVRIETRAVNRASAAALDAAGERHEGVELAPGGPPSRASRFDRIGLLSALRATGASVRSSRDAGTYLCNAALWTALEATPESVPVVLIHVPPAERLSPEALVDVAWAAVEAMA